MGWNKAKSHILWNLHEPTKNGFDFPGDRNAEAFARLAGELGVMVILQPDSMQDVNGMSAHLYTFQVEEGGYQAGSIGIKEGRGTAQRKRLGRMPADLK